MISLSKYLKLADLQAFSTYIKENPRPEGEYSTKPVGDWFDKMYRHRQKAIVGPCMKFFKAKLKAGELQIADNSHGLNYVGFWNALVQNGEEHHRKWGLEHAEHLFSSLVISPGAKLFHIEVEGADVEKIYTDFIEYIDAGNFAWYAISEIQTSSRTGEYMSIQFENWTPVVGSGRSGKFVKAEIFEPRTEVETLQIEFKTGNLIGMDWFRGEHGTVVDDAFRAWTETKGVDDLPSIGNDAGNIATVEFYAKLGIVHVYVGNSSPNVYTGNGMISVGNNWREYTADGSDRYSDCDDDGNESEEADQEYQAAQENPPVGMIDEGSVCTDLWWVTLVERERLVEILIEQLGEEHREEVEAYAAGEFDVNMQVEPGKYTLHFDADPSEFYERLDDKQKFSIGTPYFALTKDIDENITE